MRIKPKRSQITIIMIVGLVIFIIIGLLLYLSKTSVKKTVQSSVKRTQSIPNEIQPIKEFVSKCVDKLSKDATTLIGKQGGYIYSDQGGTYIGFSDTDEGIFFVNHDNYKTTYNIKQPSLYAPQPYATYIPAYPWNTFPYRRFGSTEKTFYGIYGINNMPPLNYSRGPHSIQTQIETFVDNNLDDCMDFTLFEQQGYDIEAGKSRTKALIGSKDISVKSEIPIKITNTKTKENFELKDFSTVVEVRMKDIHNFISNLVENDITDIKFNIKAPQINLNYFDIKVMENAYQNDDILIITDTQSALYGENYEYVFARKNRAPALYFIKESTINLPRDYMIYQDDLLRGSELNAEDPDEDSLKIMINAQLGPESTPTPNVPGVKLFGKEFFVVVSYFDALRASDATLDSDFAYLKSKGTGGIRIFPNWWNWNNGNIQAAADALIDENGNLRQSQLDRLRIVLDKAKNNGFVVDVSFARETAGQGAIDVNEYKNGIVEAIRMIKQWGHKDIVIDIQNEHNGGITYLSDDDVKDIRNRVKQVAPEYPLGASIAYDASTSYAIDAAEIANLDVILYHDPRTSDWYQKTGQVVNELKISGKPVYLSEPERWRPGSSLVSSDFMTAMSQAKSAGAAAWTFHTEAGFDLASGTLQSQLSNVESEFLDSLNLIQPSTQPSPIEIISDLPVMLDRPQIKFKIEANDGRLSDYQIITVNRQ